MALHIRNEIVDPDDEETARQLQERLSRELRLGSGFRTVAAADVAYSRDDEWGYVAAVVLSTTNWSVVHRQRLKMKVTRPYQSGMLGFREAPLLLEALLRLPREPDLVLVDGSGTAHPRRFGLACHVGYALDHPTVGVAKNWPAGCDGRKASVPRKRGTKSALLHDPTGAKVGYELFTQDETNPVYVSPGNRVDVEGAANFVLRCAPWFRLPEPLRAADQAANEYRREEEEGE